MLFRLYSLRFRFAALGAVHFPARTPANTLRGGLGLLFRRLACTCECTDAARGGHRPGCLYARVFEPSAAGAGPSGLADWPRPFVLRAAHLGGAPALPGEEFHFDVHLFNLEPVVIRNLVLALAQLAKEGVGLGRGRARLIAVDERNEANEPVHRLCGVDGEFEDDPGEPLILDLRPAGADEIRSATVRFLTPTELKSGEGLARKPDFPALFARARDRVITLMALYQDGPAEVDFETLGRQAGRVRMVRCEVRQRSAKRRSSRTGQTHPLGGFVGEAEYQGPLRECLPFLRAAQWTGVGRHTVWGNGQIEIESR